jgi:thiamine pyrophosphokinase
VSVKIPERVKKIGYESFYGCKNLTYLTIESGDVDRNAFIDCINLTSLVLGSGVESCAYTAFDRCPKLVEVINKSKLDSSDVPDLPNLTIYPCEKDQTDSELALDLAIDDGYSSIWMIAPFGGRLDHTMANVALLEKAAHRGVDLKLYDGKNLAFLLAKGEHSFPSDLNYISFFPINESATISLYDFKYPLENKIIQRMIPLAVSNEPAGNEPKIIVHQGTVLCICIE